MTILLLMLASAFTAQTTTKATFYFRTGPDVANCPQVQTFNDGHFYGPCNNKAGARYGLASKYWVAIRDGGDHCGETIVATHGLRSIEVMVMDVCIGCKEDNHVDFGLEALIELTGSPEVACAINLPMPQITWKFKNTAYVPPSASVVAKAVVDVATQPFVTPFPVASNSAEVRAGSCYVSHNV